MPGNMVFDQYYMGGYMLDDNITGVLAIGSFVGFNKGTLPALQSMITAGAKRLIIDTVRAIVRTLDEISNQPVD